MFSLDLRPVELPSCQGSPIDTVLQFVRDGLPPSMFLKYLLAVLLLPLNTLALRSVPLQHRKRLNRPSMKTQDTPQLPKTLPISLLSGIGSVEMAYLTYNKLMDLPNVCLSSLNDCNSILTGPFSLIPLTNIPLTAIGLVSYSLVLLLSTFNSFPGISADNKESLLQVLTSSMATFSLYLMFVLQFVLHASCPYCYLSALLSFSLALLAWNARIVPNRTKAFILSSSSFAVTALASGLMFYFTTSFMAPAMASTAPAAQFLAAEAEQNSPKSPPEITKSSSPRAMELAARMKRLEAKMYGAYWCSHCYNQKQELGKEAFEDIPYIECDKNGLNSKKAVCKANKIPGYPTWELGGKLYPGEKSIEELEELVADIEKGKQ